MAEREVKIKFSGDAKALKGTAGDIRTLFGNMTDDIDDARGAGAKLGDAMKQAADKARAELKQLDDTVAVVADSLGPEMTDALEKSGKGIADYIAEWKRLGLTYDDIKADSDSLAAGLKELDSATRRPLDGVGEGLRKVEDGASKAKDTVHSFAGNAISEIPGVTDAFGPLGEAVSQLTEGLLAGEVGIGGLAAAAGPIAGIAAAVVGVTKVMDMLGERTKQVKEQTEKLIGVQQDLAQGDAEAAARSLYEQYGPLIKTLQKYGFTIEEVIGMLDGSYDATARINGIIEENIRQQMSGEKAWDGTRQALGAAMEQVGVASEAWADANNELDASTSIQAGLTSALLGTGRATKDATSKTGPFTKMLGALKDGADAAQESIDMATAAYDRLTGRLDEEDAWAHAQESMSELMDGQGDLRQELRDTTRSLADYINGIKDIPASKKTELLAKLDEGDIATVYAELDKIARKKIAVNVAVRYDDPGFHYVPGGPVKARASGGPISAGQPYLVGEQGPELVVPRSSGNVVPARKTARMLSSTADSITINVQAPVGANMTETGRQIADALRTFYSSGGARP